ncbi:hypothetical protein [Thermosphaera sp.]
MLFEKAKVKTIWRIEKYASRSELEKGEPFEILEFEGNVFLNEGINLIWTAVCGGSYTPFNAANAHIGVGDGTTAESPDQTGLQGVNKHYKGMDSGYPVYGSNQRAIFRATFNEDEANFAWNEITVANGNNDAAVNLNRKVQNMGTKSSGSIWVATLTLSIS